jgi:exopolysaccharide production protein ExoQ
MEPEHVPELCWETAMPARGIVVATSRMRGRDQASRLEMYFATAMLVFASSVLYMAFVPKATDTHVNDGESAIYTMFWISGYLVLVLLVGLHFRGILAVLTRHWPALVLLFAYLLSEIIEPNDWRRLSLLFCTVTFSAWMAARFSLSQIVVTLNYVFSIVMVIHALDAFVDTGGYVADSLDRGTLLGTPIYAGLFAHKQQAGIVFSSSFVFYSLLMISGTRAYLKWLPGASMSLLFLLLSGSASALLVTLVTLGASLSLWALIRNKRSLFYMSTLPPVVVAIILFVDSSLLFEPLGRSADLTGRTTIWDVWPELFYNRLLTGYGYSGLNAEGGPGDELVSNFGVAHFHNSFLDVGIQAGAPGLFLLLLIILLGLVGTSSGAYRLRSPLAVVFFALFLNLCLFGLVESSLLSHNNFTTMYLFAIYLKLGIELRLQATARSAETVSRKPPARHGRLIALPTTSHHGDIDETG